MAKNVLLTGAAQGIGRVVARYLLSAGHKLFLIDNNDEELMYTIHTHLKDHHTRVHGIACDVSDRDEVRKVVKDAAHWFDGKIDVLVNNAGIARPFFSEGVTMEDESSTDEFLKFINTNLLGAFLVSQQVIPFMKLDLAEKRDDRMAEGGCIIHIASVRAHISDANSEGYGASKGGILGLTQAMSVSCQQWAIRVNAISPGWISVKHENRAGDEEGQKWDELHTDEEHERQPTGRVGRGEDIGEAVEYLMNAGFVTGQEIVVDGGVIRKRRK
jgi:NAD(P)-dependent dehydrogenase (short-subunit alcohol dehydrogenase family)